MPRIKKKGKGMPCGCKKHNGGGKSSSVTKKKKKKKKHYEVDALGIDPSTYRMLSDRSTI